MVVVVAVVVGRGSEVVVTVGGDILGAVADKFGFDRDGRCWVAVVGNPWYRGCVEPPSIFFRVRFGEEGKEDLEECVLIRR